MKWVQLIVFPVFLGAGAWGQAQEAPAEAVSAPEVLIKRQRLDVNDMLGQDAPKPVVNAVEGSTSATRIRNDGGGLKADVHAELQLPRPLSWSELLKTHPALPNLAPWLQAAPGTPEPAISPLFHALYQMKWEETNQRMLDGLPAEQAAEFYDLAGAWELPAAGKRPTVLALHGVFTYRPSTQPGALVSSPVGNPTAVNFLPRTVYRWPGGTASAAAEKLKAVLRIQSELEREYAISGLPRARNRELEAGLAQRKAELNDLPKWNYLNSQEIIFVSLPLLFRQYPDYAYSARVGDLALILTKDQAFPAIIGDEISAPHAGQVSEALYVAQHAPPPAPAVVDPALPPAPPVPAPPPVTFPDVPPPAESFTILVFTGSAPAEPGPVTAAQLRERVTALLSP